MSLLSLNNKTAVITGAGSGIGQAIALKFTSRGAFVHILELNKANAKKPHRKSRSKVEKPSSIPAM